MRRLIRPTSSLEDAREWVFGRVNDGVGCPCCGQFCKVYRRKLTSVPARVLIEMSNRERRSGRARWIHIPTMMLKSPELSDIANQGGYRTLSQHWSLIEEEVILRPDRGRAGWWRITPLGLDYVRDDAKVSKYALLYDSRCLGLDGPMVTIRDALGVGFDLQELMEGE
jgi:hypothetical protein